MSYTPLLLQHPNPPSNFSAFLEAAGLHASTSRRQVVKKCAVNSAKTKRVSKWFVEYLHYMFSPTFKFRKVPPMMTREYGTWAAVEIHRQWQTCLPAPRIMGV